MRVSISVLFGENETSADGAEFLYYPEPRFDSFAPSQGRSTGGSPVTIAGTDFLNGTMLSCKFARTTAPRVLFVTSTQLVCYLPGHP
eukprot:2108534-Rhodomonas_salina.1